jgi:tellurite resistance protein TehA-like permease
MASTDNLPARSGVAEGIANLFPGYFALVMATGIVSIACFLLEMALIAWALLQVNVLAYVVLWILFLIRLVRFWPRVRADIISHARGPGFFTLVAGTCVLGSQLLLLTGNRPLALVLFHITNIDFSGHLPLVVRSKSQDLFCEMALGNTTLQCTSGPAVVPVFPGAANI